MKKPKTRTKEWQRIIRTFPKPVRSDIDSVWDNNGNMPANIVGRVLGKLGAEIGTLMMKLLPLAQQYAVVPVSHYQVGAVAAGMPVGSWCSLYLGANFEFTNSALSFTVHAEQAATNNAWLSGQTGMTALAISAAPCGYCRQFLYELVTAQQLNILLPSDPKNPLAYSVTPLTKFLPDAFGPNDLGVKGGLMDPKLGNHKLVLTSGSPSDPVIAAALEAAKKSYAPYTTAYPPTPTMQSFGYAGVAVQLNTGTIWAGRHAENAAYNPSLSPLESALAFMNMNEDLGSTPVVKRCVLVEVSTLASQRSATIAVIAAYAPGVALEYYTAKVI